MKTDPNMDKILAEVKEDLKKYLSGAGAVADDLGLGVLAPEVDPETALKFAELFIKPEIKAPNDEWALAWVNQQRLSDLKAFLENATAKAPAASGIPTDALPMPSPEALVSSPALEFILPVVSPVIQKEIDKLKMVSNYKPMWGLARFCSHSLCAKGANGTDREVVCLCRWRAYLGDASILPQKVQASFNHVVKRQWVLGLLTFGHALRHILGLCKF